MKKFLRIGFKVALLFSLTIFCVLSGFVGFVLLTSHIELNTAKITESSLKIDVFNQQGLLLQDHNQLSTTPTTLQNIPKHVSAAFLSIEDKKFFSHHGVSTIRMCKAVLNNLKSHSFKEGASTITQQLIKNTHLSSEKNLSRKINEIKLAVQLEKEMTKDEILENYLNVIYFGSNCYGIESASQYYFSKPVQKLSISEGACLAGIIKSPNYYSPISHPNRAESRRNLVLREMKNDGIISDKEYYENISKPLVLNVNSTPKNKLNSYSQSAIDEACECLGLNQRQLALGGYKIYTHQNLDKQIKLQKSISEFEINSDFGVIDINAKTGGIEAFIAKSPYKILNHKRQIGSIAKPLFVYAPAFNENILTPASVILDEPITIGGFSPKNVSGTYQGYVDTRKALSKSLNIPAVKAASYVGLNKISSYANKMNLPLDEKDYTYSLALGGLTYGYNLKDLTSAYSVFTGNGVFTHASFVDYITTSDGKIIYKTQKNPQKVFRDDTSYLITDILKTCAKSGTAKKLADLPFEVAAKTGTVGTSKGNTDAYNVSFTTEDIVGVWMGNMDNKLIKTAGGNQPTALAKEYYKKIYLSHTPKPFVKPSSVEKVDINQFELENNHILVKASEYTSPLHIKTELFSRFNLPKNPLFVAWPPSVNLIGYVENNKAVLKFTASIENTYNLCKTIADKKIIVKTITGKNGQIEITDSLESGKKTEYFLEIYHPSQKEPYKSSSIGLILKSDAPSPKWYI